MPRALACGASPSSPSTSTRNTLSRPSFNDRPPPTSPSSVPDDSSVQLGEPKKLSNFRLLTLTLALGGAQLVSSIQAAYATSFLVQLGVSTPVTALVWISAPVAAMVVQPSIGTLSDRSPSRFRRRRFIALSTLCIVLYVFYLVYADGFSVAFEIDGKKTAERVDRAVGVLSVVGLQFAMQGLQASVRDLILDCTPSTQRNTANAWAARLSDLSSLLGYLIGSFNLRQALPFLHWIGGGQFRKLAWMALGVLVVTATVTCATQREKRGREEVRGEEAEVWGGVREAGRMLRDRAKGLPVQVKRVCVVQFFAWAALFPFLFYSTTYIADVFALYADVPADGDTASRTASLALLFYTVVAFAFASILPLLILVGNRAAVSRFFSHEGRIRHASARGLAAITLRRLWTLGLVAHFLIMMATFWATTVLQGMVIIAAMGIPWAITGWVPYALIVETVRELEADERAASADDSPSEPLFPYSLGKGGRHSPPLSPTTSLAHSLGHRYLHRHRAPPASAPFPPSAIPRVFPHSLFSTALLHRSNLIDASSSSSCAGHHPRSDAPAQASAILGLHNLSICLPQLVVAILTFVAFKIADKVGPMKGEDAETLRETLGVIWLFRASGVAALGGAVASLWLEETRAERDYRERLVSGTGP
ncbi:hypothetical protein JCM6882_008425 [Rhodosporidiobolus microsporus]